MASLNRNKKLHNQILISRLLQCRDPISPVTLLCDSLHQTGWPLIHDIISKAKAAKVHISLISFETLQKPPGIDLFIALTPGWAAQTDAQIQSKISAQLATVSQATGSRSLVIIDTLHPLINRETPLSPFLSSFLSPSTSLLILHHNDIPLPAPAQFAPRSTALLHYLATTILTVHSLSHVIARKKARDRSVAEPEFGLEEGLGTIVGLGSNSIDGTVVEMEHRRKSGRVVREWFYVSHTPAAQGQPRGPRTGVVGAENVILLDDHARWPKAAVETREESDGVVSSFRMELNEKEKREREGVLLPYFDAQTEEGGMGGRILYDMGVEDDFDEEEDEI
jgi:elongator complex protein 5